MSGMYGVNTATVPSQNTSDNNLMSDVVGNKTDDENGTSLYSKSYLVEKHLHGTGMIYPSLANGVTLTAVNDASNWSLGALTEIVPVNTITTPYDLHQVFIESASTDTNYQINFYYGASDTYATAYYCTRDSVGALTFITNALTICPIIPANSRLRARVATPNNNGETITLKVFYHPY